VRKYLGTFDNKSNRRERALNRGVLVVFRKDKLVQVEGGFITTSYKRSKTVCFFGSEKGQGLSKQIAEVGVQGNKD